MLGNPIAVGQIDLAAEDAVTGRVIDLPRRPLDRVEHDVLVEAGHHAGRELDAGRMLRVELSARDIVLPSDDLLQTLDADDPERGGELAHAVVQAGLRMRRLRVVAEGARVLDQLWMPRDEHAALAGGDRLRRCERPQACVAPRSGATTVP